MAILLTDYNIIIQHIPRTGGEWIDEILIKLGINTHRIGNKHGNIFTDKDIFDLYNEDYFFYSIVRHPVEWYRSLWCLKSKYIDNLFETNSQWHPTWGIDSKCYNESFNKFIENIIYRFPGFSCHLYDMYTKKPSYKNINMIGKTENIRNDLCILLDKFNINYDKDYLMNYNIKNASELKFKNIALYTKDNFNKIIELDRRIINEYNYNTDINNYSNIIIDLKE